jgi:hypothetical protein
VPKAGDGITESIRALHTVRTSAIKSRTACMNELHALLVTAPTQLREQLAGRNGAKLAQACAELRPLNDLTDPAQGTRYALRTLANRWHRLNTEITGLDTQLATLVKQALWVPNIVSQGLIWGFAVLSGSAPAGSQDGSAAAVLDRLTDIRLDRAALPIPGIQRRRDSGVAPSTRGASSPDHRSPAIVGGSGNPFRARAAAPPAPSASPVRHATDTTAMAR